MAPELRKISVAYQKSSSGVPVVGCVIKASIHQSTQLGVSVESSAFHATQGDLLGCDCETCSRLAVCLPSSDGGDRPRPL